jgi:hypothetical protein
MSLLARKELRLLLPAWIAALAAASMPLWIGQDFLAVAVICFLLTALFLGLTPFGQEMNWGTFGLLLSQPERRERFWKIKSGLLAFAMLSAWALLVLSWWIASRHMERWNTTVFNSFSDMIKGSGCMALAAFSGGLWTTLLLREMTTAFFTSVLVPTVIQGAFAVILWFAGCQESQAVTFNYVVVAVYAVAGYFLARRLFMRAQDVAWTGGQISLASGRGNLFGWLAIGFREKRGPWSALIWKELQMQQFTLAIVPLLLGVHLAALAVRHFAPLWAAKVQVFDFAALLWMGAPIVVGCAVVAEERRYNTLEGFLCLPVRKRNQLLVKFAVVMALGTVLGGALPSVLEFLGRGTLVEGLRNGLLLPVLLAAAIAGISFFASTMSRGMLQAFTLALLFPVLVGASYAVMLDKFRPALAVSQYGGWLLPVFLWPALLISYVWMAFRNYKCLQTGWSLVLGNAAGFIAVLAAVLLVAGSIYNRSWEYFMGLEPQHGSARLSGPGRAFIAGSLMMASRPESHSYYALLPDGRLWVGKVGNNGPMNPGWNLGKLSGHFADGSNWVDLAVTYSTGAAALKSDGTLWKFPSSTDPSQIGSASDWKKVVAEANWFLALKKDGTIWGWGTDQSGILTNRLDEKGRGLKFPDPIEIWQESDWVDVFAPGHGLAVAVKRDGVLWKWGFRTDSAGRDLKYPDYHQLVRVDMGGDDWSSLAGSYDGLLMGVRTDGSLWAGISDPYYTHHDGDPSLFGTRIPKGHRGSGLQVVRIGTKSDWVGVTVGDSQFLALEADGTFWTIAYDLSHSGRPSKYHDWLAASVNIWMTWTLAKDGTINCWSDFSREYPIDYDHYLKTHWFVLRQSRRPLASINILDAK